MERMRILDSLPTPQAIPKSKNKKKSHGKIGFEELAKLISQRWKNIDPATRIKLAEMANKEKLRYVRETEEYKLRMRQMQEKSPAMEEDDCEPGYLSVLDHGISELASKLDQEMTDMIITAFR